MHKYDPDTRQVGAVVKCHDSHEKALAHMKALYANVEDVQKEVDMSSSRKKRRMRSSKVTPEEILKEEEQAEEETLLEIEADEPLSEEEQTLLAPEETEKELQKDYYPSPSTYGAKSWEEVDELEAVRAKTEQLRKTAYAAEDLVYNILYAPDMTPDEKAGALKKVADGFGERATQAAKMEKETDLDLLELEAILAKDGRDISIGEQVADWLTKKKLTSSARKKLSDSDFALPSKRKYPVHDKAHVRNALSRAAQQIKAGGEGAKDAKAALPKIRAAAKKFGIGQMNKELGGLLVEKDAKGDWRWVGWPSNKWKDRDGEIIRESAHEEYVAWVNKNMDAAPVFASWHIPGSAREHPVDYVGYVDGFLIMSGKLTEYEAQGLLEMQKEVDLGLSLGGICWFDKEETHVVNHYRSHEVSDLPLEKAANPFTEFTILTKEASMNKEEYIQKLAQFLPEDRQKAFLEKTQLKKEALEEAQIESKETSEEPPVAPSFDYEEVKEKLLKELDVEGLSEFVKTAQEAIEKVPILEAAVEALSATNQELKKGQDERLAEMIAAPAQFPWSKRASQSEETVLQKDDEKDKELEKAAPQVYWLNEVTQTQPLSN